MKRNWKKILIILVAGMVLFLAGGYGAYKGYKHVRQVRLVKQAKAHIEADEKRKAVLCLQRALRYNNRDTEAVRLMVELAETESSTVALVWRSRLVDLNPQSTDDRMALARTALLCREISTATNALNGIIEPDRKTAAFHNLAGMVAAAAKQVDQAETHFKESARLDPADATPLLNLAVIHLQSTNAQLRAEARASLDKISSTSTNSALRSQALRELAADSLRQKDPKAALQVTSRLLQQTNAVFRDKLIHLEVLQESKSPEFRTALSSYQDEAGTDPLKIQDLAMWQLGNTTPAELFGWLATLPDSTRTNASVILLTAQCQDFLKDWRGLQAGIENQNWGDMEFLRHAYLARAQRGQDLTAASKGEWELALKTSNNRKEFLGRLLLLAAQWRWQTEYEEILWSIVNRYPDDKTALQALTESLYRGGRTRPLMMLFNQELKRDPSNLSVKNNLAVAALLLDASELKPHELAREVYTKAPTNAAYASTYAFSLYLQEKPQEALNIMQSLPPQQLSDPSIAGYYGLILSATGDRNKAQSYINWAFKGPMLPEEKRLFEQARGS